MILTELWLGFLGPLPNLDQEASVCNENYDTVFLHKHSLWCSKCQRPPSSGGHETLVMASPDGGHGDPSHGSGYDLCRGY